MQLNKKYFLFHLHNSTLATDVCRAFESKNKKSLGFYDNQWFKSVYLTIILKSNYIVADIITYHITENLSEKAFSLFDKLKNRLTDNEKELIKYIDILKSASNKL
ncbi:MAG: hypothetical protein GY849_00660 [Deltaproteobacteria bacterium]|nr:hypothetical protein [Deltaproteobacteria bacterium]